MKYSMGVMASGLNLTFWCAILLSLFGCGGAKTVEKAESKTVETVSMRYKGKEVLWEPTYARFATFKTRLILKDSDIHRKEDRLPGVVHRIYLANYDLELTDPRKQDFKPAASEGQYRVEIMIEADQGAPENAPLRAGEYAYKEQPYNRIAYVFLSYFNEGKDRSENLQTKEFAGRIKITPITDREIKGEIEVSDKQEFVRGSFIAQRLN